MIQVKCEQCGTVLQVADAMAGKRGRCQTCASPVLVPDAANASSTVGSGGFAAAASAMFQGQRPANGTHGRYPEIPHNAELVRFGARIIGYGGRLTSILGGLAVAAGVIGLAVGLLSSDPAAAAFGVGFGMSSLSEGFWAVVGGAVLIALAAFFQLLSHTCEAMRDHIIDQQQTSAPRSSERP